MARIVTDFSDDEPVIIDEDDTVDGGLTYTPLISIVVPGFQGPASTVPGPKGDTGEKGDKGEKGDSIIATSNYLRYEQNIPAMDWYVPHDFTNPEPDVSVIVHGEKIFADVDYPTPKLVHVSFAYETTGVVQLG